MPLAAGCQVVGERLGRADELFVLKRCGKELLADALAMLVSGVCALELFAEVIDAQGQNP